MNDEAAERLRSLINGEVSALGRATAHVLLDEALVAERRATVDRIYSAFMSAPSFGEFQMYLEARRDAARRESER